MNIKQYGVAEWPALAADAILFDIDAALESTGICNLMLTGGRAAARLYTALSHIRSFSAIRGLHVYFGDERCVPPDHVDSNYAMAMRTLFRGETSRCNGVVYRLEADDADPEAAARRYEEVLPVKLDIMLISIGEDGHIASLFPNSPALLESSRRVVPVVSPKPPRGRLTITPGVIKQATTIYVLATGAEKARVLQRALDEPEDYINLPARLVLRGTWLMDSELSKN